MSPATNLVAGADLHLGGNAVVAHITQARVQGHHPYTRTEFLPKEGLNAPPPGVKLFPLISSDQTPPGVLQERRGTLAPDTGGGSLIGLLL